MWITLLKQTLVFEIVHDLQIITVVKNYTVRHQQYRMT